MIIRKIFRKFSCRNICKIFLSNSFHLPLPWESARAPLDVIVNCIYLIFPSRWCSRSTLQSSMVNAPWIYPVDEEDISIYFQHRSYHVVSVASRRRRIPFHLESVLPRYSKHYSFCTLSSHLLVSMVIRRGVASPVNRPQVDCRCIYIYITQTICI